MTQNHASNKRYLFYATLSYSFGVLRPIERIVKEQGGEIAWFIPNGSEATKFATEDDVVFQNLDSVFAYNADAVLAPGNYIPDFIPGVKVQVFHGFDSGKKNKFNIRGFFDLYCTQGPNITDAFNAINDGTCNVVETGWSKLDPLFAAHKDAEQYRVSAPLIIYAPTFSPKLTSTYALISEIKSLIAEKDWHWLIKLHPKAKQAEIDMYSALACDRVQFIETGDIIPLLQAADVLLSDTSSVLAEFALQGKPVVAFNNRKPASWMLNFMQAEELEQHLSKALERSPVLMTRIREYCDNIHPYRDGQSSTRVVAAINALIESGTGHLKPKPMNLLRRFKMRKKFKYWRL